jgi:hypothetical protein
VNDDLAERRRKAQAWDDLRRLKEEIAAESPVAMVAFPCAAADCGAELSQEEAWFRAQAGKRALRSGWVVDFTSVASAGSIEAGDFMTNGYVLCPLHRECKVVFAGASPGIEDGGQSKPRTSQRQPHASARNDGTNQADSSKPRAADFECMEPVDGGPKPLPETAVSDDARSDMPTAAPINLRGASAEARNWGGGTNAEPHSTQNGADPTRDHVEPTAGIAEGPHVRIAGVTSESALSRGPERGETVGADPST